MQRILKVVKCGECFTVKSEKAENGCLLVPANLRFRTRE